MLAYFWLSCIAMKCSHIKITTALSWFRHFSETVCYAFFLCGRGRGVISLGGDAHEHGRQTVSPASRRGLAVINSLR